MHGSVSSTDYKTTAGSLVSSTIVCRQQSCDVNSYVSSLSCGLIATIDDRLASVLHLSLARCEGHTARV
jgi:hypothetical protein